METKLISWEYVVPTTSQSILNVPRIVFWSHVLVFLLCVLLIWVTLQDWQQSCKSPNIYLSPFPLPLQSKKLLRCFSHPYFFCRLSCHWPGLFFVSLSSKLIPTCSIITWPSWLFFYHPRQPWKKTALIINNLA